MIKAGIDLGTGSVRLVLPDKGIVFDEAAMIAVDEKGHCLAYGDEALEMKGITDEQVKVRSLTSAGRFDLDAACLLLDQLFYQFRLLRMFQKTELVLSYPDSLPEKECALLKDRLLAMGIYKVYFDKQIWMSAIGAGLDLSLPVYSCVLNMGFHNCDIAVFSKGQIVTSSHAKAAGDQIRRAIRQWLKASCQLAVSDHVLEQISRQLGCALPHPNPAAMEVTGFDVRTHTPRSVTVTENDVAQALGTLCQEWVRWIAGFLASLPADAAADVRLRGIVCCGGAVKLAGLQTYLQSVLNCPVYITEDPASTVSRGIAILLSRLDD